MEFIIHSDRRSSLRVGDMNLKHQEQEVKHQDKFLESLNKPNPEKNWVLEKPQKPQTSIIKTGPFGDLRSRKPKNSKISRWV